MSGATWAEVADELDTTPAGAKRRFQRAQEKMRREFSRRIQHLADRDRALVTERLESLGLSIA